MKNVILGLLLGLFAGYVAVTEAEVIHQSNGNLKVYQDGQRVELTLDTDDASPFKIAQTKSGQWVYFEFLQPNASASFRWNSLITEQNDGGYVWDVTADGTTRMWMLNEPPPADNTASQTADMANLPFVDENGTLDCVWWIRGGNNKRGPNDAADGGWWALAPLVNQPPLPDNPTNSELASWLNGIRQQWLNRGMMLPDDPS